MSLLKSMTKRPLKHIGANPRLITRQPLPLSAAPALGLQHETLQLGHASGAASSIRSFSTTPALQKKHNRPKRDFRIKMIRYHLNHPILPRPLRLSRLRSLRHWTIHRAWQLLRMKQHRANETILERQYNSMRDACEALRLIGEDGLAVSDMPLSGKNVVRPPGARDRSTVEIKGSNGQTHSVDVSAAAAKQTEVGKLYRIAMEKKGIFQGVPIEYARIQTDTPPKAGWNHDWTRG